MRTHEFRWSLYQVMALPGVIDAGGDSGHIRIVIEDGLDAEALKQYLEPLRFVGTVLHVVNEGAAARGEIA